MTTAGLCNLLITGQDLDDKRALNKEGIDPDCGDYPDDPVLRYLGGEFTLPADQIPGR